MPYKLVRGRFRRKRNYRTRNPMATATRMMPQSYAFKRRNQVATKVFWFKINGTQSVSPVSGDALAIFRTRGLVDGPQIPQGRPELFELYDQFKVLAMRLRWFPANVGTEPGVGTVGPPVFLRGDQIVWSDQRIEPTAQVPQFISEVINNASARMINPRRPFTRVIYRPKGHPEWGSCNDPLSQPDPWNGAVYQIINNASAIPERPLWYYTLTWKVVVRGRRQS